MLVIIICKCMQARALGIVDCTKVHSCLILLVIINECTNFYAVVVTAH